VGAFTAKVADTAPSPEGGKDKLRGHLCLFFLFFQTINDRVMQLRLLFVITLNLLTTLAVAQQTAGIRFAQGNWQELVALAEKEQRPIFVDVYTDWCAPCKLMDATVFKEKLVGDKYNKAFVCYKLNAEKGEGRELAKQFNIKAYPTFLFLNSSGFLLHKVVGEKASAPFLAIADEALGKVADKDQLGNLEAAFRKGNRQPSFLRKYIVAKAALDMDNSDAFTELIKAWPADSLKTATTLLFIGRYLNGLQTPALQILMQNYNSLNQDIRAQIKPRLYNQVVDRGLDFVVSAKRLLEYEQLREYARQLEPLSDAQHAHLDMITIAYATLTKNDSLLKPAVYKRVGTTMDIPVAEIKKEDKRRYDEIMAPFLRGEKDSTKTPGFEEEREFIVNIYSRDQAGRLYEAAKAFAEVLPGADPARKDALQWAERARLLMPGINGIQVLIEQLKR
jgi:thiol-disulfide isomerase/thioredoxin